MTEGIEMLESKLNSVLANHDECLVEERIHGVEATCAVIEDFRDSSIYVLPPVEIIPPADHDFFDAEVKYAGAAREICPGRFT
ncbi:hypothetical protein, partial [Acinetobacter baumannii]|uniref:hypothetical protein n=1 Tax=Acinetobacter baumannii TaxID=470 RepID=UPI0024B81DC0